VSICDILLEKGKIKPDQLQAAMASRKNPQESIDQILVQMGFVKEEDVLAVLSEQLDIPVVDLQEIQIDVNLLKEMPSRLVHRRKLVPISKIDGVLTVATCNPYDLYAFEELRMMMNLQVETVLATEADINRVIKKYLGVGGGTIEELIEDDDDIQLITDGNLDGGDLESEAQEASVIKLVNEILVEALNQRASDVHIEPFENDLLIRYRIDGVLHNTPIRTEVRRFQAAIISRIKILSNLNIAEKRLPQDGGFKIKAHGRETDIRVSIIPTIWGEAVVMRLLDKTSMMLSLGDLGMMDQTLATWEKLIQIPHGILLVTGPTGSGKTTTLYGALHEIVSPEIKVLTIEDPVEYQLGGINQVQVNRKINLTFAAGLRSFLRHDPDVILVGEIRDLETAETAIQASLTGHLVFSTLHTNDAASANTRLLDMGVEPFLVASSVEAVLAQRLVRKICTDCKEAYKPDPNKLPADFNYLSGDLWRGKGCRRCNNTGYRGRLGIFELLVLNDEIRELIMKRSGSGSIIAAGRKNGLVLLREDGWNKVRQGITTPAEVTRVTKM
jgi:general secretion pathway protein E/type IV pilus assembly protein PilB